MPSPSNTPFAQRHCVSAKSFPAPMPTPEAEKALREIDGGWKIKGATIERAFRFRDFHETMAFVNAVAWIAHREDHHPEMEVGYRTCRVTYTTHAVKGLTNNDFICAAKIDALVLE